MPRPRERLSACTDGSEEGQHAVAQALALGQACGAKVYALQVVRVIPEFEAVARDLRADLEEEIERQQAATAAAATRLAFSECGIRRISPFFSAIVAEAEPLQLQLIDVIARRPPHRHAVPSWARSPPGSSA